MDAPAVRGPKAGAARDRDAGGRNEMHRYGAIVGWTTAAGLMLGMGTVSAAQRGSSAPAASQDPRLGMPQSPASPGMNSPLGADESVRERTARIAIEQEKARNDERQKKLISDTEKLLSLATELKSDVDKTNKDTLSVDVVKKAEEIEKLAHSVKEKMKGS